MHYLRLIVCLFFLLMYRVADAQSEKEKQRLMEVQKTFDSLKQLLPGLPDDSIKSTQALHDIRFTGVFRRNKN